MIRYCSCLVALIIAGFNFTSAQDAKAIIHQSQQKVSELKTCSYLLYGKTKVTGMRDTSYQTGKCSFININKDTVLGRHTCIENFSGNTEVYNGTVYFKSRKTDSTVYIWDTGKFNFFKQQLASNPIAYGPLLNKKNAFSSLADDKETTLSLAADTVIDAADCYHIKSFTQKLRDHIETGITITADLYIRKSDYMPIGHVQFLKSNINYAISNYESYFLENLAIDQLIDKNIFTLASTPKSYTLKQQGTINIKNYIVVNEQVPDFDYTLLQTTDGYKNIKGKNVLIGVITSDNCYPCSQAIKLLEKIYQNSKKKNLLVIVIATKGLADDKSIEFLTEQRNTFPSLFDGQKIIDKAAITVFPTFYLFNEKAMLINKNEGFNERLLTEITIELEQIRIK